MGYGDDIMATAEARELKVKNPRAKILVGDGIKEYVSPIFEGNPSISRLKDIQPGDQVIWLKNYYGCRPYIDYTRSNFNQRVFFKDYNARPGDLYIPDAIQSEVDFLLKTEFKKNLLVMIEPNVAMRPNKDWDLNNWQAVVNSLHDNIDYVQPAYPGASLLQGARPIPTKTFLHGCALLKRSDFFLGSEGGLHHASAALGVRAIVLFGGRIHPNITGYSNHINIYIEAPDSPCGMFAPCEHCRRCLEKIRPEQIIELLQENLNILK